ncbi:MAG TPA: hypothetical protein PKA20_29245 [Burkholderiaceae bacterium]|nr:hypothetical protein [Burkholderiaceae bacterium]
MTAPSTPRRLVVATCLVLSVVTAAQSQPVDVRQGQEVGSGYAFRRGEGCVVLTAAHVVPNEVAAITVTDRSGAKRSGQRVFANEADVALVELPGATATQCAERWPDSAWLRAAQLSSRTLFEAVRHEPGGRETIVTMRYAGGTANSLTLAPVDRMTIVQSDSGSIVRQDGRMAGIVTRVDPATDRVEVLRFDLIDKLVGDRFRAVAQAAPVQVDGVFQRGRPNPNWSAYLRAWVGETTGRLIVPAQDPSGRCRIAVDVLEWKGVQIPNQAYDSVRQQDCRLAGKLFGKTAMARCEEQKRDAVRTTPRALPGYAMSMEIRMTPRSGPMLTRLASGTVPTESGQRARTADDQFNAMQAVMAPAAKEMLATGVCD